MLLVQQHFELHSGAGGCGWNFSSSTSTTTSLGEWGDGWCLLSLTSTSTTTSTRSQSDVVRDAVNQALVHGGQVDVIDFIRRLLDRQRKLRREAHLLGEALEEAISWLPVPQQSLPLNAAEYERQVYNYVAQMTARGSAVGSTDPQPPNTSLAVLLQPNFPEDIPAVAEALPGYSPSLVAGLRRRAWRDHLRRLQYTPDSSSSPRRANHDRVLYLVQTDPSTPIMNWPHDTPRPVPPQVLRENFGLANRRRLRVRRPSPRLTGETAPRALQQRRRRARAAGPRAVHPHRRRRAGVPRRRVSLLRRRVLPPLEPTRADPSGRPSGRQSRDRSRSRDAGPEPEIVD